MKAGLGVGIGLTAALMLASCGGDSSTASEGDEATTTREATAPAAIAAVSEANDDCCSCGFSASAPFAASEALPCDFDYPAGWQALAGDDGVMVSAAVGASCGAACPVSPGLAFSVAKQADSNAGTRVAAWRQVMTVAGDARCGDGVITFFSLPGAEPTGVQGGLRFYIPHRGGMYAANVTFTCPEPGEWMKVQRLFIDSFRSNDDTSFGGG